MKISFKPLLFSLVLFLCCSRPLCAQRFALGSGATLVSNTDDLPELNAFVAHTLYGAGYLRNGKRLSLLVEFSSAVRNETDAPYSRRGTSLVLPLTGRLALGRWGLYGGAGIAYQRQRVYVGSEFLSGTSGFFADFNGGVGYRVAKLASWLAVEGQLRVHYLRSTKGAGDGANAALGVQLVFF